MLISLNWIKDYVDLDGIDIKDLWYRFTMSTAEVEDVIEKGKEVRDVVVGKILKVEPHPESKKLTIVQVDTGEGVVQSVCGAPNVREGICVPFAKMGGSIKNIPNVGKAKVAGIESNGIICSAAEIGISDDHSGILILREDYPVGTNIKEFIDIDDVIIEVDNKSLTNRPDLWGHYGIAREFAAIFKRQLKPLDLDKLEEAGNLPNLDIDIRDREKCSRYSGISIKGVKAEKTPLNMQVRLYYCGMRPIEPIVDLTNYIMLEVGQPMHAFDKRMAEKIVVQSTDEPIKFFTLDSVERQIPEDTLMICNQDGPVAIAGIMGGENSEISEDTDSILLESASFEGYAIRKSSTKIGLRTEASARFEKMLDPELTVISIKRFVKLLRDIKSDIEIASNLTDVYARKPEAITIAIDKPYIDKYIGNVIDMGVVVDILKSLEFSVKQEGNNLTVDVPSFRATKDISIKADLVEEITRIYGYDNIVPKTVEIPLEPLNYNEERLMEHKVKELMAEKFGFSEVNSYIWYDDDFNKEVGIKNTGTLRVLNPQAKSMNTLRDSMVPGMLSFAERNVKSFDEFSIFEIGSVFNIPNDKSKCKEHKNLCILTASKMKNEDGLFYELKGISTYLLKLLKKAELNYKNIEYGLNYTWIHPVKSVTIELNGEIIGYISVVHPQVRQNIDRKLNISVMEINMYKVYEITENEIKYREPSRYPEVTLDFSFLVDVENSFKEIDQYIAKYESKILNGYRFVDIYAGKGVPDGKKSMTFRFNIGSRENTLSSEEINKFSDELLKYMESKGYTLR